MPFFEEFRLRLDDRAERMDARYQWPDFAAFDVAREVREYTRLQYRAAEKSQILKIQSA